MAKVEAITRNFIITDSELDNKYITTQVIAADFYGTIYRAFFSPNVDAIMKMEDTDSPFVALKVIHFKDNEDLQNFIEESETSRELAHNNIISVERAFTFRSMFCTVMPYMRHGSLLNLMHSRFKDGLPAECISVALREALTGLFHLHQNGKPHKEFGADQIFYFDNANYPCIKLAYGASVYRSGSEDKVVDTVAPEVYEDPKKSSSMMADVWMVGIAALELGYGRLPVSNREELLDFAKTVSNTSKLPSFKSERKRKFSRYFPIMVADCLSPVEYRPSAEEFLSHTFFTKYKDKDASVFRNLMHE